jgi:hypothetical protein
MKWFAVIFSIYIIYLVTLPCVDNTSACMKTNTENVPHSHDHDGNDIPGECSPFCFCSCCSISIVITNFQIDLKPVEIIDYFYTPDYKSTLARYITPVWQPPRLI